ncbi:MAG: glycosyl transferase family 1, partial [Flavobacteriales bacterium]
MTTAITPKILLLTYYWPPSGGSGVQRWMYFAKHLKAMGWEPIVITVAPNVAAYPVWDASLAQEVENITVIRTASREPLRWYQRWTGGSTVLPQGAVPRKHLLQKLAAFVRGNFFLPDARKGWVPFAIQAAEQQLAQHSIGHLITTGPPHSTHLVGLAIKKKHSLQWWADFRDPWSTVFYNSDFYRLSYAQKKDARLEREVLQKADGILTTVAGNLHRQ